MSKIFNKKNIPFYIIGSVLIFAIIFLLIQINSKRIDEKWKTDKITITLADGSHFDIENKETVTRISRLCNDGIFRTVPDENKVNGSCEIWIDFNNGTIIGMFLNRDYGYVGDTKQYVGESLYLPNGLNEFIRNIISTNIVYDVLEGKILEESNLSFLVSIDEKSKNILDTETVLVSYENLPFSDIKELNFKIGDKIKIYFNGEIIDTYPPKIYCSKLELIVEQIEETTSEPILNQEEIDEGYESKLVPTTEPIEYETEEPEVDNSIKFNKISLNDTSITSEVPSWVLSETSLDGLYSFNNADYLIDTIALEEFANHYSEGWSEEILSSVILGQGIKAFNLDSDSSIIYYPAYVNGNIIGLLKVEEFNGDYEVSLTHEFINALNEMKAFTSMDTPLILIKTENVLCGMIGDMIFAESDVNVEDIDLSEISGEVVIDVLKELTLTEVPEVSE